MKDKRKYSLTAKERKQLRAAEQKKSTSDAKRVDPQPDRNSRADSEAEMVASQKRSKNSAVIVGAVIAIAVILIVAALIAPVIAYLVNPYRDYDSVIARFELSNGMRLEYVIEEEEYDIAATNFIFLAKNGYFDNTVLFDAGSVDDNTDGWVRFGGYENQPGIWESGSSDYKKTNHHAQNKDYCSTFSALPNERFKVVTTKFSYDLYPDKTGEVTERLDDIGVLAYLYNDTSTEFQMSYKEQPSNEVVSILNGADGTTLSKRTLKPTMVGYALNDQTVRNLQTIASSASVNTAITSGVRWVPPTPTIYIKTVKVYNLNGEKWDDFDFISYMNTPNKNGPRLRGWTGRL